MPKMPDNNFPLSPTRLMKKMKLKIPTSTNLKKTALPLPFIELTVSTWLKDSHGLYDYEAPENKRAKEVINIVRNCKIYRKLTTLQTQIVDDDDARDMPIESLYVASMMIDRVSGKFQVQPAEVTGVEPNAALLAQYPQMCHKSSIVVRDYEKNGIQGYPLTPGCLVKFGRVEYIVLEIRDANGIETFQAASHFQLNTENYKVVKPLVGMCRICLSEESTEEDPLISPCLCRGSCQFVHVGCLKNWINSKVKKQYSDIVLTINFSKFECEICKTPYPKAVTLSNKQTVELITYQKPDKPYIILESLHQESKDQKKQRNMHMISGVEGLSLKIGRGHQCELRINDISVSRSHAEIMYKGGCFIINDLKSKFGTLVRLKETLDVKEGGKLQLGRVCFEFAVKNQQPKLNNEVDTSEEDGLRI